MALLTRLACITSIIAVVGLVSALSAIPGHLLTRDAVYGIVLKVGFAIFLASTVACLVIYMMMGHKSLQSP